MAKAGIMPREFKKLGKFRKPAIAGGATAVIIVAALLLFFHSAGSSEKKSIEEKNLELVIPMVVLTFNLSKDPAMQDSVGEYCDEGKDYYECIGRYSPDDETKNKCLEAQRAIDGFYERCTNANEVVMGIYKVIVYPSAEICEKRDMGPDIYAEFSGLEELAFEECSLKPESDWFGASDVGSKLDGCFGAFDGARG